MTSNSIVECARNLGPSPRWISLWDRLTYWRVDTPKWLKEFPDDATNIFFYNLGKLRRNGVVVWGHIIQANSALFKPGDFDSGAEVVYSLDLSYSVAPAELAAIASALFSLKHTEPPDPELAWFARYLTNELIRIYGRPVPASISPRRRCLVSTTYLPRKHFPGPDHCLKQSFLPILVNPKPPHVAMVLPSRYWPESMLDWWHFDE